MVETRRSSALKLPPPVPRSQRVRRLRASTAEARPERRLAECRETGGPEQSEIRSTRCIEELNLNQDLTACGCATLQCPGAGSASRFVKCRINGSYAFLEELALAHITSAHHCSMQSGHLPYGQGSRTKALQPTDAAAGGVSEPRPQLASWDHFSLLAAFGEQ